QPAMQRPTAVPRIPASASGVSTHRSAPNLSRSPAVARKTPPAQPTSSPITSTESSRPSSVWKASLIASTSVSSAIEQLPQLSKLGREGRRRRGVGMFEQQPDIGRRLGLPAAIPDRRPPTAPAPSRPASPAPHTPAPPQEAPATPEPPRP